MVKSLSDKIKVSEKKEQSTIPLIKSGRKDQRLIAREMKHIVEYAEFMTV